jgi:site-specific recombinase XerD
MSETTEHPRRGRPRKYATDEERRAADRERMRRLREARRAEAGPSAAKEPGDPAYRLLAAEDRALIDRYIKARAMFLAANSKESYRADLATFALARGGHLLEATTEEISAWLLERTRDVENTQTHLPWSLRTAKRKLSALIGFYRWAVRTGLSDRNPADTVEIKKFRQVEPPPRIAPEHLERLFSHIEDRIASSPPRLAQLYVLDAVVFRLCFHLALRITEASSLRFSKVVPGRNELGEEELQVQVLRKGDKIARYPITGSVLEVYRRWLRVRQTCRPKTGHEDYVFVHPWYRKRISRKRAWLRLQSLAGEMEADGAPLPPEVLRFLYPHALRHACAHQMADEGEPLHKIQSVLGHANVSTTSIYINESEEARLRALRERSQG